MELDSVEYDPVEIADLDIASGSDAEISNSLKVFLGHIRHVGCNGNRRADLVQAHTH